MRQLSPILSHSSTVPRQQPAVPKVNSSPRSLKLQHLTRLDHLGSEFFLSCINLKKWHTLYQQLPKKTNERFSFSQLVWAKIQKLVQTFISQLAGVLLTSFYYLFTCVCIFKCECGHSTPECVMSEDKLQEPVPSFHRVGPGLTLRL